MVAIGGGAAGRNPFDMMEYIRRSHGSVILMESWMHTVISMAARMLVRNALIYDSLRERTLRTQKICDKTKTTNPKSEVRNNLK
jgi:hypothetical protein